MLVYGWGAAAAGGLVRVLETAGYLAHVASTEQVLAAGERAVVLSPLPSLEAMARGDVPTIPYLFVHVPSWRPDAPEGAQGLYDLVATLGAVVAEARKAVQFIP